MLYLLSNSSSCFQKGQDKPKARWHDRSELCVLKVGSSKITFVDICGFHVFLDFFLYDHMFSLTYYALKSKLNTFKDCLFIY